MSVTFAAMTCASFALRKEACLCTQMSDHFGAFVRGERVDWEALRPDANPECAMCSGTGVEEMRVDLRPQVNFSNGNAKIILRALGLASGREDDLIGDCSIVEMRRGIILAKNTTHPDVLRTSVEEKNFVSKGYTRDDLMHAIARLEEVVQLGENRGATRITWS